MENNKIIKEVNYEYISKVLNLSTEDSFRHITIHAKDALLNTTADRSIRVEDAIIMWICRSGSCVVSIDGGTYILLAGQVLFVFAGVYCRFSSISSDFVVETLLARINRVNGSSSLEKAFSRARQLPILNTTHNENMALTNLLRFIDASMNNWSQANRMEHDNAILSVLRGELMEMYRRRRITTKEPTATEQLVNRFERLLATNYLVHRDVEWYANYFEFTPKRFSAKIKRVTGKSPSDMIATEVVKNAKRLLLNSVLTSSEISERLNFATPSFFCRYFKRYTGVSPQEWRSQNTL